MLCLSDCWCMIRVIYLKGYISTVRESGLLWCWKCFVNIMCQNHKPSRSLFGFQATQETLFSSVVSCWQQLERSGPQDRDNWKPKGPKPIHKLSTKRERWVSASWSPGYSLRSGSWMVFSPTSLGVSPCTAHKAQLWLWSFSVKHKVQYERNTVVRV